MKRKIRHALVQYTITEDGKTRYETAFRNQIVDIPDDQVQRLDDLGATVAPDESLERPGTMSGISDAASDQEIMNWVMGASDPEVEELARQRPAMAGRLEAAHAAVKERAREQNEHLGSTADDGTDDGNDDDLIGGGTPAALTEAEADEIVAGNAKAVVDYISEHPGDAFILVEAEHRRSAAKKEDVRVSIVKAAEAAIGFTK